MTAPLPHTSSIADRFVIVLNRTQDVINIATALRAMMNTGFTRLRLVSPDDFNAYRIGGIAHGSEPLIERIEFFDTLPAAVADAALVIGTTARRRAPSYVWQNPRDAAPALLAHPATAATPIAIVFGREDTGLLNEDLDLCSRVLVVPTSDISSSLNLAQAVLLVGYELWLAATTEGQDLPLPKRRSPPALPADLDGYFRAQRIMLEIIDFFKKKNPEAVMRSLRALTRRADLTRREANLLRAIAIEVTKFVQRREVTDECAHEQASREGTDE